MSYDLQLDDGDIVIDNQGDVIVLEGYDKLYQDLTRLVLTSRGDNKFDVNEGCGVYDLLGKAIPRDLVEGVLSKELYFGLNYMIQQQTSQSLIQTLSSYEQISTVDAIALYRLELKKILFEIAITTMRGVQVGFLFNIK